MTQLLYAYCLISLGVKITCSNQTNSNAKSLVVATQGSSSYKDNISCVFGIKQLQSILEIKPEYVTNIKNNIFKGLTGDVEEMEETVQIDDVEINLSEDSNDAEKADVKDDIISPTQNSQGYRNVGTPVEFTGFISTCAHGSGRSSTDRQFFYVNNRPCEPTKIIKLINEIYRQYNPGQYPFVFLNVNLEGTCVDVNVTPDKRKVFLTKEKIILDVLKNSLLKLFESIPRTLKVEKPFCTQETILVKPELDQPRIFNSFLQQFGKSKSNSEPKPNSSENNILKLKRKSTTMLDYISAKTVKTIEENDFTNENDILATDTENISNISPIIDSNYDVHTKNTVKDEDEIQIDNRKIVYLDSTDNLPDTQIRDLSEVIIEKSHTIKCKTKFTPKSKESPKNSVQFNSMQDTVRTDQEDIGKKSRKSVTIKTSLEHVKALTELYQKHKTKTIPTKVKFKSEINPVFNKICEEELSREISKDSFRHMKVIGQFNLGFIITKLDDDLFIIDQHATDEIYNFEMLQNTTELTCQKLVIPQQLELTGVNEQVLMDNLEVFKKNGFTFDVNEEAPPTKRVKLLTLPMSKNWVFGKADIEELLFMLRESPSEYCRPSRVRAMFASRACRKSVMIGTALSKADMKTLVTHMGEIDKPWNCPHGRPTIRHLVNLAMVQTRDNCD